MKKGVSLSYQKQSNPHFSKKFENKSWNVRNKKKETFLSSERDIIDFRYELNNFHPELAKEQNIIELLLYIKTLNGINPLIEDITCHISGETRAESLIIIKKWLNCLTK